MCFIDYVTSHLDSPQPDLVLKPQNRRPSDGAQPNSLTLSDKWKNAEAIKLELYRILNRWRRKYPARLVRTAMGGQLKRVELMQRDIGFLLRIIKEAMNSQASGER